MISRPFDRSSASRRPACGASSAWRLQRTGRLPVAGDRRECLFAPHGAQHRGDAARCAARADPLGAMSRILFERRAPPGGRNRTGRRPVSVARRIPCRLWHSCATEAGFVKLTHVLVRANRPVAHQDRAPHPLGSRRAVGQVPRLRCGAVPRRNRAQSARLSQVQPPHAHQRAGAPAEISGHRFEQGNRRQGHGARIRSSSRTRSATATASRRPRSRRASAMRWS